MKYALLLLLLPAVTALDVDLFVMEDCKYSADAVVFADTVDKYNDDISIRTYDVSDNLQMWEYYMDEHGMDTPGAPMWFIDGKVFLGYLSEDSEPERYLDTVAIMGNRNQILNHLEEKVGHEIYMQLQSKPLDIQEPPAEKKKDNRLMVSILVTILLASIIMLPTILMKKREKQIPFKKNQKKSMKKRTVRISKKNRKRKSSK